MKRKVLFSLSASILCILLVMSTASGAINFLATDGYWSYIDSGYDGVRIDVVGVIGVDPGAAWTATGKSTQDYTLVRNATVCTHDWDGDGTLAEWTGTTPPVYTGLGSHTYGPGACNFQGLFISEYIEGLNPGGIDAIEIYNNSGLDFDFSVRPYWIEIFNGGNTRADGIIPLTGSVANGQTYVIASGDIPVVIENLVTSSLTFSGDDAVAIVRGYTANTAEIDDADTSNWATGPTTASPNGTTGLTVNADNPAVQLTPNTDWNQVRYGVGTDGSFATQSGLAFRGVNRGSNPPAYGDQVPFLVGKFCHVNHPISVTNQFKSCPLTLDLYNIGCGDFSIPPNPPARMTFVYPVFLDETPNSGLIANCPYPSTTVCSDAVTFGVADSTFRCFYTGGVMDEFTVAILGFMPVTENGSCDTVVYDEGSSAGIFISQEGATNCGCMFAMITQGNVTAVELLSFDGERIAEGVKLTWETASETDNLGFNLYRAESLTADRILLNEELIPTNVPAGSPFGSVYEFLDTTAVAGQHYLYWLEDVDLVGAATLHGPVEVTGQ